MFDQIHRSIRRYSAFLCLFMVCASVALAQTRTIKVRKASIHGIYACKGHHPELQLEWEGTKGSPGADIAEGMRLRRQQRKLDRKGRKYTTYAINKDVAELELYYSKRSLKHFRRRFHKGKLSSFKSTKMKMVESKGKTMISDGKKVIWVSYPLETTIECYTPGSLVSKGGPSCVFCAVDLSVINAKPPKEKRWGRIVPRDDTNGGTLSNNMSR